MITHTAAEGTLAGGTVKGDRAGQILKGNGFSWSSRIGVGGSWYIRGSRDRRPRMDAITGAEAALTEAGYDVEVQIERTPRPTAVVESERAEQNKARIAALTVRAGQRIGRADAMLDQVRTVRDNIPLGQPNIVDPRGRSPLRNLRERLHATEDRGYAIRAEGVAAARRAQVAEANQAHHLSGPATERRILKGETQQRHLLRILGGDETHRPATGEHREQVQAELARVRDRLAWDRDHLATLNAEGTHRTWDPADFGRGDYARCSGRWLLVVQVNQKSLTVPHWSGGHTDTSPYNAVSGRRSATEHLELLAAAQQATTPDLAGLEPAELSADQYAAHRSRGTAGPMDVFASQTREVWPAPYWALRPDARDAGELRPVNVGDPPTGEPALDPVVLTREQYRRDSRDGRAHKLGPVLDVTQARWLRRGATHGVLRMVPGVGPTFVPAVIRKETPGRKENR
ncbi:MAG: DUF3560 domain-containing protein [Sciscionella sp.]